MYKQNGPLCFAAQVCDARMLHCNTNAGYIKNIYDYFIKDHLGNVRMTLTTEQQTDLYAATMEPANATKEEALFNNLSSTRTDKPGGFDNDGANAKVIRLNGDITTGGNKRVGPSMVLKVMAGDAISISTQAWYQGSTQGVPPDLPSIVNELAGLLTNGILSNGGDKSGTNTQSAISGWVTPILTGFENNKTYDNSKPKAYLNWVIVDEEFKEVLSSNHKGAIQVNVAAGNMKQLLVGLNNLTIRRNGWLYVYLSNESNQNVYFDDLIVNHKRGPVVAAQDYYPFGMEIAGLSTKSIGFGGSENRNKFNKGSELQSKEFYDGSGLEIYSTMFRMYDPQIGRWNRIDPKPNEMWSLYVGMDDNPISFNDPLGDTITIRHRTGFLGIFGKFANYRYDNGKLYNSSGTEVQRGGTKRYVQKAAGALDALRTGGPAGQKLVTDLQNSPQNTYVMKGAENKFNYGGRDGAKGSDGQLLQNVVRWSPGNGQSGLDQNGSLSRPGFIGLGHELAHAYDHSEGGVQDAPWFTIPANLIPGGNDGKNISKGTAELYATHIENQIRAENNLSLRVNYMQQIINDPTSGLPFGLIITPGMRTNVNTFTANGITYTNPTY